MELYNKEVNGKDKLLAIFEFGLFPLAQNMRSEQKPTENVDGQDTALDVQAGEQTSLVIEEEEVQNKDGNLPEDTSTNLYSSLCCCISFMGAIALKIKPFAFVISFGLFFLALSQAITLLVNHICTSEHLRIKGLIGVGGKTCPADKYVVELNNIESEMEHYRMTQVGDELWFCGGTGCSFVNDNNYEQSKECLIQSLLDGQ
jgi:hypothetical protein